MIVTKENFQEAVEKLNESFPSASFVSIDEEMTGIFGVTDAERIRRDDVPSSRYERMVPVASKYRLIQFGLCLFHEKGVNSEGAMQYDTSTYTFFLFPESNSSSNGDLVLSIGAIDFLKRNNMDFGKWIDRGIPYVSRSDLDFHRKRIFKTTVPATDASGGPKPTSSIVLTKPSDLEFMNHQMDGLKELVDSTDPTVTEFTFEPCNAYLRRYIYQMVDENYSDSIVLSKSATNQNSLQAQKVDAAKKAQLVEEEMQRQETQFRDAVGFAAVYDLLTEFKGPIVGHNCLFDILFLMKWLEGPLPDDFAEFRELLSQRLPNIYDTKFFAAENVSRYANSNAGEDTTLQICYEKEVLGKHVPVNQECSPHLVQFPVFSSAVDEESSTTQFHDAGWDAYCTGCLFATQMYIVKNMPASALKSDSSSASVVTSAPVAVVAATTSIVSNNSMEADEEGEVFEDQPIVPVSEPQSASTAPLDNAPVVPPRNTLEFYRNKLFMMRSMFHMNLDRSIPRPRSKSGPVDALVDTNVFNKGVAWNEIGGYMKYDCYLLHLSEFAPNTNNNDIMSAFTGGSSTLQKEQLYVSWIDNFGVFVQIDSEFGGGSVESFIQHCKETCLLPAEWVIVDYDVYLKSVHVTETDRILNAGKPRGDADADDVDSNGKMDVDPYSVQLVPVLVKSIKNKIASVLDGLCSSVSGGSASSSSASSSGGVATSGANSSKSSDGGRALSPKKARIA